MRSTIYHTETKAAVIDCLKQSASITLSVADIMEYLKNHCSTPNITTVYRILDKLEGEHTVIKHTAEDGKKAVYQYVTPDAGCMYHLHVQCSVCGKIVHLDCNDVKNALQHISREHGIQISCSASLLYGICDDCLKKKSAETEKN